MLVTVKLIAPLKPVESHGEVSFPPMGYRSSLNCHTRSISEKKGGFSHATVETSLLKHLILENGSEHEAR